MIAATSPFIEGRSGAYIVGGMAGVVALPLLLFQPLLAAQLLPGPRGVSAKQWHLWIGRGLVFMVTAHVAGLYIASPMDALDALLLASPTPFSVYGVVGLWAVVGTALLVALRRRLGLQYRSWIFLHNTLGMVIASATVVHALQIEGTMGAMSKTVLCLCVLSVAIWVVFYKRLLRPFLG